MAKQKFEIELEYRAGDEGWDAEELKEYIEESEVLPDTHVYSVKEMK